MSGHREQMLEFLGRRAGTSRPAEPVPFGRLLERPEKIIVVPSRGAKGFAFAFPSLALLRARFPQVALHVLADEFSHEVFETTGVANAAHVLDSATSWRQLPGVVAKGKTIAAEQFDFALWLDDEVDSERRVAVQLAARNARVGRTPAAGDDFFNCQFQVQSSDVYPPLAQLALTQRVVRAQGTVPRWTIGKRDAEHARQLIHFWKPRREDYLFVVDPGRSLSGATATARKLLMIVELLKKTYPCRILITSEPACTEAVELLRKEAARWDPIQVPHEGLARTSALLSQADLFIGANTTLFHFAWILGVPALGLFGRMDDERHVPPPGGASVVVRSTEGLEAKEFLERVDRLLIGFPGDHTRRS
jgi:ADP-heptose:LPS heptosyltransferase